MTEFEGKVAVITGGASGIGLALAEAFACAGMKIVMSDVEEPALVAAASHLAAMGAVVHPVVADVSQQHEVRALADKAYSKFGSVHVLCNNAGVAGNAGSSWSFAQEDWQWTLGVNFWGVLHGIQAFVPRMLAQGGPGHIVNTASVAGLLPIAGAAPYSVSKHAVVALSESLALELKTKQAPIGVSLLCPAGVATRIVDSDRNRPPHLTTTLVRKGYEDWKQQVRAMLAVAMPPAEVAGKVVEAIRANQFYVLTHPETRDLLEKYQRDLLDGTGPSAPAF